jgi:hypothetical protein
MQGTDQEFSDAYSGLPSPIEILQATLKREKKENQERNRREVSYIIIR